MTVAPVRRHVLPWGRSQRAGVARAVPVAAARRCGICVLLTPLLAFLLALAAGVRDLARDGDPFLGGWHWQSLTLASVEASLVVAGSIWLLAWAQRHLTAKPSWPVPTAARTCCRCPCCSPSRSLLAPCPYQPWPRPSRSAALRAAASFCLGWAIAERTKLGRVL